MQIILSKYSKEFDIAMKSISLLNLKYSANVYCATLAVFILLVYPYILKKYLAKSA